MKNKILIKLICCYLLTVTFVLFLSLIISSNKYEDDIYDLRLENQECEYYIVPTEDGFIIDGQLYELKEGYEVYE